MSHKLASLRFKFEPCTFNSAPESAIDFQRRILKDLDTLLSFSISSMYAAGCSNMINVMLIYEDKKDLRQLIKMSLIALQDRHLSHHFNAEMFIPNHELF